MVNKELLDFIKQQLAKGMNKADIVNALTSSGWDSNAINEGFSQSLEAPEAPISIAENGDETNTPVVKTKNKKSKKLLGLILLILIVLGLAGGSASFAYYYAFPSPERILSKTTERIAFAETVSYNSRIELSIGSEQSVSATLTFDGAFNMKDMNNIKSRDTITINNFSSSEPLIPEIIQTPISIETIIIDRVAYIKVVLVSPQINLGYFNLDLSSINNKWIEFTPESLQQNSLELPALEGTASEVENYELSDEQIKQIRNAYKNSNLFKFTAKLPSEKIDGVNTHHFSAIIDKQGFIDLTKEILLIIDLEDRKVADNIDYADLEEDLKIFDDLKIEFWVGKWDWAPRKISLKWVTQESAGDQPFNLKYDLFLKDFNKPVVIEAPPPPVKTLMEVVEEISAQWVNSFDYGFDTPVMPDPSTDHDITGIDSDNDQLSDDMEAFWGTDPNNPDTDGDGYMDGEELLNEYDPLGPGKLDLSRSAIPGNTSSQLNSVDFKQGREGFQELIKGLQANVSRFGS